MNNPVKQFLDEYEARKRLCDDARAEMCETLGLLKNTLIYARNVLDSQDKSDEELEACKQLDEAIALIEEKTR